MKIPRENGEREGAGLEVWSTVAEPGAVRSPKGWWFGGICVFGMREVVAAESSAAAFGSYNEERVQQPTARAGEWVVSPGGKTNLFKPAGVKRPPARTEERGGGNVAETARQSAKMQTIRLQAMFEVACTPQWSAHARTCGRPRNQINNRMWPRAGPPSNTRRLVNSLMSPSYRQSGQMSLEGHHHNK